MRLLLLSVFLLLRSASLEDPDASLTFQKLAHCGDDNTFCFQVTRYSNYSIDQSLPDSDVRFAFRIQTGTENKLSWLVFQSPLATNYGIIVSFVAEDRTDVPLNLVIWLKASRVRVVVTDTSNRVVPINDFLSNIDNENPSYATFLTTDRFHKEIPLTEKRHKIRVRTEKLDVPVVEQQTMNLDTERILFFPQIKETGTADPSTAAISSTGVKYGIIIAVVAIVVLGLVMVVGIAELFRVRMKKPGKLRKAASFVSQSTVTAGSDIRP